MNPCSWWPAPLKVVQFLGEKSWRELSDAWS
jgi:hypothetical protein